MVFKRRRNRETPSTEPSAPLRVEIAWGGFYTVSRHGEWRVMRLLDFNTHACHVSIYREQFATPPPLAQVAGLSPAAMHAPMAATQIVNDPMQLLAPTVLTEQDLYGYRIFLEQTSEMDEPERDHFIAKMIHYSKQPPIAFRFWLGPDGNLQAEQSQ